MKKIIAMAAIAAAFTMASCNKEQPVSPDENPTVGKSVITASIENGLTKAHLDANGDDTDGYKVFWSEGDDLIVGGGLDEYGNYLNWVAEYKLEDSSAGSSQGTFSWQTVNTFISMDEVCQEPSFEAGNMYMAVHPFDLIDMNTSAFTWRTEQTYNGTTGYIPMIAAAEGTEDGTADFKFTNLGGLLRLTVKGTATIKTITVKAKEPMSGELDCFAMDEEGNIVALMGNDDGYETYNYINLDCGESGVALSSTGTDFYISMPCHYSVSGDDISLGGYSEVTITLTDMKDNICEKKLSSNKQLVIERSKITPATFTASEFKSVVTVKFDLNNAGMIGNFNAKPVDLTDIDYNTTITEPNTLFAENYVFRGWYKEATCENAWDFANDKVVCNTILYAKWASNPLDESDAAKISDKDYVKLAGFYWATENVLPSKKYWNYSPLYPDYYDHYDAQGAVESWGAGWTLPSSAQWQALLDNCICEWKTDFIYKGEAMKGLLVTGKEEYYEKGHSIFLPICSIYNKLDDLDEREAFYYFRYLTNDDNLLILESNSPCISSMDKSFPGGSVRPVASI